MKILIAGDFCDNGRISDILENNMYKSLFGKTIDVIHDSDVSIVNFEFPIVFNSEHPISKCGPNLKGQKNAVNAIKFAGFNVCTLANNHILDQGEECCVATKLYLEKNGIATVGVGDNIDKASMPLYCKNKNETIAIVNCCEHEFSVASKTTVGANPLNPIQQFYKIKEARNKANYVLVIVHGGHEHYQLPSPRMKETYRFFIDAGADAVVNHHQHCYSGYEIYNEKPIFYGLGNFLFDWKGRRDEPWNEGFMVSIDFNGEKAPQFVIYPYVQCNDLPSVNLMNEQQKSLFETKINNLNNIIADDVQLTNKHEEWMTTGKRVFQKIFEPYSGKILSVLYRHSILPSFITKRKRNQILDYINCESHLDKLRFIMKK